jgi:hypothetical protein
MTVAIHMDLTTLFDSLVARDEETVVNEIAKGLLAEVPPSQIAGRLGIAAALGDSKGHALSALVAAGRIGDWIRVIPPGPEPQAERRQLLLPTIPLASAALYAAPAIAQGLQDQKLKLPAPIFPKDVAHKEGSLGALRDALVAGDAQQFASILMGFYSTGTDYREMESSLYYAINAHFSADGAALLAVTKATQQLDSVEWGDRVPSIFQWLLPLLVAGGAEREGSQEVRSFIGDPVQSLDFVRTRLAMSNPAAAGAELRQQIQRGSRGDVLNATMSSLKNGATPPQVAAQICIASAEFAASAPSDDASLNAATTALRVANSARLAVTHVQNILVLPLLFHAANLVNTTIKAGNGKRAQIPSVTTSSPLAGGLIEYAMLRNTERQLMGKDEGGARATIKRYTQMAFSGRSLSGTIGLAAVHTDLAADANARTLLAIQAVGEDYLSLSQSLQTGDGAILMEAAAHLVTLQQGDQSLAQRIEHRIA